MTIEAARKAQSLIDMISVAERSIDELQDFQDEFVKKEKFQLGGVSFIYREEAEGKEAKTKYFCFNSPIIFYRVLSECKAFICAEKQDLEEKLIAL